MVSLSGSEEMESVIERVLERMLANRGGQNLSAASLVDEVSTLYLYSKITVPDNIINTDGKKVELDGVATDQLAENQEGKEIRVLSDKICELEQKLASASAIKETVEKEKSDLKLRLGTRNEYIASLTRDNGNVKAHLELKLLKQGDEVSQLKTWLAGEKAANVKLSNQKGALETKIRRQCQELATLNTKIQGINAKGKEKNILLAKIDAQCKKIMRQYKELVILNTKNQGISVKEKENTFLKAKTEEQSTHIARQCKEVATLNAKVRVQNGTLATLYSKVQSENPKEQEIRILRAKMEEQSKKIGRQCEEMTLPCASEKKKDDKILKAKLKKQSGSGSIDHQREELKPCVAVWRGFRDFPGRDIRLRPYEKRTAELSTGRVSWF